MVLYMCSNCRLEVYEYDKKCPSCNSTKIEKVSYERSPVVTMGEKASDYVNNAFAEAESLLVSEFLCFCDNYPKKHYLVWPRRSIGGKQEKITTLPFCPFRIEQHSNIVLNEKSISKLEV